MGTGSRAPGTVGRYHGNFQSTFFEEDIGKHLSISSCKFPTRMWQHSSHLLHRQRTSIKNLNGIVFSSQFDFILFAVRTWISCIYIYIYIYFVQVTQGEIHCTLPWPSHCHRVRAACPGQPTCLPKCRLPCKAQEVNYGVDVGWEFKQTLVQDFHQSLEPFQQITLAIPISNVSDESSAFARLLHNGVHKFLKSSLHLQCGVGWMQL